MRVRLAALFGSTLLLAGCGQAVLAPVGPVGHDIRSILVGSLVIMLTIVVPTIVATIGFAWWFRAGNHKARYQPDWEFSPSIEIVVWFVPLMVIILLGGVTWIGSQKLDPARPLDGAAASNTVEIEVVSLDWKWLFVYPQSNVATLNRLVVPTGVPLRFRITSSSVFNTFFVPRLGSMIYAMNGMATTLHLQADEPGTFLGLSGHFSGDGFSDMHFDVQALPAADWDRWLAETRAKGGTLDASVYRELVKPQAAVPPRSWAQVMPGLFDKVVGLEMEAGPGPSSADNKGVGAARAEAAR